MEEATGPTLREEVQQHSLYEHMGVTGVDMHLHGLWDHHHPPLL